MRFFSHRFEVGGDRACTQRLERRVAVGGREEDLWVRLPESGRSGNGPGPGLGAATLVPLARFTRSPRSERSGDGDEEAGVYEDGNRRHVRELLPDGGYVLLDLPDEPPRL